jgi:hypothetical protein
LRAALGWSVFVTSHRCRRSGLTRNMWPAVKRGPTHGAATEPLGPHTMARRTFDVVDVTEIFIHWHTGRSISEVSRRWSGPQDDP